ncbi:Uncharacterised protein [Vibrio cholerae]|nr:Uncharacterised protein [Vibrio cholerae]
MLFRISLPLVAPINTPSNRKHHTAINGMATSQGR